MAAARRPAREPTALERATILFDPAAIRDPSRPSEDEDRLIWMLLTLVRTNEVSYAAHFRNFERHERTFQRDLAKLRKLGAHHGFTLTTPRRGMARLAHVAGIAKGEVSRGASADLLRAVVDALGEIVSQSLHGVVSIPEAPERDRFLRLATPRLRADTLVAERYRQLRDAWLRGARVRFRYPNRAGGQPRERIVEPYLATYHSGRFYLVGYDTRPRVGWRQFALDRIAGPIALAGSFERRPVPVAYRGEDALGLFKSGRAHLLVVELSNVIAEAVTAREWQRAQIVERRADGSASITFEVFDLGEGVRWAFGFGPEARIVAPPDAVALARHLLETMLASTRPGARERDRALSDSLG
jgi:predicted DNA-binding transcriptional regulator YafY